MRICSRATNSFRVRGGFGGASDCSGKNGERSALLDGIQPGVAVRLRARLDADADHRGQHARTRLRVAAGAFVDARVCIMLARNRRARTRTARCSMAMRSDAVLCGVLCRMQRRVRQSHLPTQACKCKDRTLGPVELSTAAQRCKAERASFTGLRLDAYT